MYLERIDECINFFTYNIAIYHHGYNMANNHQIDGEQLYQVEVFNSLLYHPYIQSSM